MRTYGATRNHGVTTRFRGDAWTTVHKDDRKRYLLNSLPRAADARATRNGHLRTTWRRIEPDPAAAFYNDTYEYLTALGVAEL
jgi:hypothetical protein